MLHKITVALLIVFSVSSAGARNFSMGIADDISQSIHSHYDKAPDGPQIEVAFSPEAGSEALVLRVINATQRTLRLSAYSFTSPSIVRALIDARKRGVDVRIVVDDRGNKSKNSVAALNLVVNAGIPTRRISSYAIHHDKFIISDARHVETGSFNYSQAAAKSNSENVIVIWNNPTVAATYLTHWQNRFDQGFEAKSTY